MWLHICRANLILRTERTDLLGSCAFLLLPSRRYWHRIDTRRVALLPHRHGPAVARRCIRQPRLLHHAQPLVVLVHGEAAGAEVEEQAGAVVLFGALRALPVAEAGAAMPVVRVVEAVTPLVLRIIPALDVPVRPD
eukprot:COSAG06_NODE_4352_length_4336_cov_125.244749_3_plen_136_part_00